MTNEKLILQMNSIMFNKDHLYVMLEYNHVKQVIMWGFLLTTKEVILELSQVLNLCVAKANIQSICQINIIVSTQFDTY